LREKIQRFKRDASVIPDLDAVELPDDEEELSLGYEVPDFSSSCFEKCRLMQEACLECRSRLKVCKNVTAQECTEKPGTPQVVLFDRKKCSPVKKQVCGESYRFECRKTPERRCKEVETSEMVWSVGYRCRGPSGSAWKEDRLFKRSSSHKKKPSPKCWPERQWQSRPKWTTVCDEELVDVCGAHPAPVCEVVEDLVCAVVQVQEIVDNPPVQSCRDVVHEVCSPGAQCEGGGTDCLANHPSCQDVCVDCDVFCNGGPSGDLSPL